MEPNKKYNLFQRTFGRIGDSEIYVDIAKGIVVGSIIAMSICKGYDYIKEKQAENRENQESRLVSQVSTNQIPINKEQDKLEAEKNQKEVYRLANPDLFPETNKLERVIQKIELPKKQEPKYAPKERDNTNPITHDFIEKIVNQE